MIVEEIMSRDPLCVEESTFLTKARQMIRDNHVRGLPVLDSQGHVKGIVTNQDMLRVTSTKSNITVAGFMVEAPVITRDMNVMDAAKLMLPNSSTILPVVQSNEKRVLIGVVSLLDVFKNLDLDKVPDKQISQIMSTKVVTTSPDDPVTKVWGNMIESDLTGMPVIDGTGKLMGMITRFDILNKGWARISKESSTKPIDSMHMHVGKLMSSPIYSIKQDDSLRTAMEMMRKYDIGRISVVDEGKLVGIVDRYDLIKSYLGEGR